MIYLFANNNMLLINECSAAMATLVKLLQSLVFRVTCNKVVDSTQRLTILVIEFDTLTM